MPRIDNDTWNLATSVGATATLVAAARAIATKADNPLIQDRFAEPLVRAVGVDFYTRWASGEIDAADVDYEESSWKLQHMPDTMAARTRFFDGFFEDATQAGIRQAVILASGLDSRAYRLAWPADMTLFEIDQPEVIEFKASTLAGLGAAPQTDLRTVAIDLRHDWPTALLRGRSGQEPADGVDCRGALRIFAAGGSGRLAGKHHRAKCAGQPAGLRSRPGQAGDRQRKSAGDDAQGQRQVA